MLNLIYPHWDDGRLFCCDHPLGGIFHREWSIKTVDRWIERNNGYSPPSIIIRATLTLRFSDCPLSLSSSHSTTVFISSHLYTLSLSLSFPLTSTLVYFQLCISRCIIKPSYLSLSLHHCTVSCSPVLMAKSFQWDWYK